MATSSHANRRGDLARLAFFEVASDWTLPIMVLDRQMRFAYANAAYLALVGWRWEAIADRNVFDIFPEIPDRQDKLRAAFQRTLAGETTRLDAIPYDLRRADGSVEVRYWRAVNTPIRDRTGEVAFLLQHVEDVTANVIQAREKELAAQELDHRTKNVLTVVQSIARMSTQGGRPDGADAADFQKRIVAMSRVHARLYANDFAGASLRDILHDELSFMSAFGAFSLSGVDVELNDRVARDLSMIVHELATNAAKYGCFAHEAGRLHVSWEEVGADLVIDWRETGVGPVVIQDGTGFGSKLIRMIPNINVGRWGTRDGLHVVLDCAGYARH